MRRTLLIVPELLAAPEGESALRQKLPALERMAELGRLTRLSKLPSIETPEALFLGMRSDEAQMRQGPLTVSALGADPPERSTHFHLSLLSFQDGLVQVPEVVPSEEEVSELLSFLPKLNSKAVTAIAGEDVNHGLVWEGLGDLGTTSPRNAKGRPIKEVLPEGDAENLLRRFIDDSINLTFELEINERRIDQGLPPFNLFWPWGHGTRVKVPNLALRRGEPALVESESLRLAGLSRLAGYKHGDRHWLGHGLNLKFQRLAEHALGTQLLIAVISGPAELRAKGLFEELEWFAKRMDTELLEPLLDGALRDPSRLAVVSPSSTHLGLSLSFETGTTGSNVLPFDERALEEVKLSTVDVPTAVQQALES